MLSSRRRREFAHFVFLQLKFEINTGPSAELRKANGYQTRQTCTCSLSVVRASLTRGFPADLDLELEIRVARDSQDFPTEFHPSTHPTEIERTDDTKLLDTALEALMEEEKSLSTELETVAFALSEAGEDGMTLDALVVRLASPGVLTSLILIFTD